MTITIVYVCYIEYDNYQIKELRSSLTLISYQKTLAGRQRIPDALSSITSQLNDIEIHAFWLVSEHVIEIYYLETGFDFTSFSNFG